MLRKDDVTNFETLRRACLTGNLTLLECQDAETGEYRAVICAMNFDREECVLVPMCHLCPGNPYECYIPPS